MIIGFTENYIEDIALVQLNSWKKAFKGILSDKQLQSLRIEDFSENWKIILRREGRSNYIWLNENKRGQGFVSYGKPLDGNERADFEIYGIYVDPIYWRNGIGYQLLRFAIDNLSNIKASSKTILWTMKRNELSQNFYKKFGFTESGESRISKRGDDEFEEIKLEYKNNNAT